MNIKVPSLETARILVVGDAMLDRYWHGSTTRISAEAPVPVVDIDEIEDRPGGAANVALNLASLGSHSILVSAVGRDEAGNILQAKLEAAGIQCQFILPDSYATTTKLRIVSQNQQLVRADFEAELTLEDNQLRDIVEQQLPDANILLLSDYDKGVLSDPQSLIASAAKSNLPVLVDPKFKNFSVYRGGMVLKPNRLELEKALGLWHSEKEMIDKCQQLMQRLELKALLVTRSAQGMTLLQPGMQEIHFPAHTREVSDVSGAGDTVIAVLAAALSAGQSLVDAVALSNVAAGMVCARAGIATISGPELRQEVATITGFENGIMTEEQLHIAVSEARSRGERIVFTNGCFDILHAGHVDFLKEANSLGDHLIVAVNDDESVHRLKGEGRPINQIDRRMTILTGLESVDWVVSFSEDTPEKLLELLKPDVLVKGGDYDVDQVVGAEIVMAYQGEVKVLKFVEDCSTSALVEKIRKL
ncbi:MAG: bifunctional D-glycero-beta-D-manno-heptose-7-phosphate kinase/D-glycero-beta-D-manno-heptose 1-phosphate adenylyltransferase HldE [Gammaproteobacteria bacterium]|nr:bifunctional D-glycero-beta-D-manno-heptose-7-phosphate kinase/D-glycero-beta-D-manno-heptose 1-phosphate adenylyltransferase HldE [Gammaproteobacteria bacterium]